VALNRDRDRRRFVLWCKWMRVLAAVPPSQEICSSWCEEAGERRRVVWPCIRPCRSRSCTAPGVRHRPCLALYMAMPAVAMAPVCIGRVAGPCALPAAASGAVWLFLKLQAWVGSGNDTRNANEVMERKRKRPVS
jgi:hypothetical protein